MVTFLQITKKLPNQILFEQFFVFVLINFDTAPKDFVSNVIGV